MCVLYSGLAVCPYEGKGQSRLFILIKHNKYAVETGPWYSYGKNIVNKISWTSASATGSIKYLFGSCIFNEIDRVENLPFMYKI